MFLEQPDVESILDFNKADLFEIADYFTEKYGLKNDGNGVKFYLREKENFTFRFGMEYKNGNLWELGEDLRGVKKAAFDLLLLESRGYIKSWASTAKKDAKKRIKNKSKRGGNK